MKVEGVGRKFGWNDNCINLSMRYPANSPCRAFPPTGGWSPCSACSPCPSCYPWRGHSPSQGWCPCLAFYPCSACSFCRASPDWFWFFLNTTLKDFVKYCHIKCIADQCMQGEVGWMWCRMFKSLQLYYTAWHGLFCLRCCYCCSALYFKPQSRLSIFSNGSRNKPGP